MKLKKLTLTNFAQHNAKVIDFPSSGVIVLQGINGSGKSQIVHALEFVLRGVIPDLPQKGMAISWGSDSGSAELDFEINGLECTLFRSLSSSKCTLTVGEENFSSVSDVNAKLSELLSVSSTLISQIVFVNQGKLTDVIKLPAAERFKLLHSICGTDRFEKVYTALGLSLNKLLYVDKPLESSAQISQNIRTLTDEIANTRMLIQKLDSEVRAFDGDSVSNKHALMISYNSSIYNPTTGIEAMTKLVRFHTDAMKTHNASLDKNTELLVRLRASVEQLEPLADKARVDLQMFKQYCHVTSERERALNAIKAFQEENDKWSKVTSNFVSSEDHERSLCDVLSKLRALEPQLQAYVEKFSSGSCPTCNTTAVITVDNKRIDFATLLQENQLKLAAIKKEIETKEREFAQYCTDKKAHQKLTNEIAEWKTFYTTNMAALEASLQNLAILAPVNIDEVKAKETIDNLDNLRKEIKNLEVIGTDIQNLIKHTDKQLSSANQALEQLLGLMDQVKDYPSSEVEKQLAEWNLKRSQMSQSRGQVLQLERNLQQLNTQFIAVKAAEEKSEKQVTVRKTLETVRDVFHRDKLPAAITRTYFASINQIWNELLTDMEVPFTARFMDNFEVMLSFANGNALIQQASGGQQTAAALTFVLAVSRLFASQIGFIVLDEPTYGLDSDRIERVVSLLHNLQSYAMNNAIQILCVTHEERLKSGFEHVITL